MTVRPRQALGGRHPRSPVCARQCPRLPENSTRNWALRGRAARQPLPGPGGSCRRAGWQSHPARPSGPVRCPEAEPEGRIAWRPRRVAAGPGWRRGRAARWDTLLPDGAVVDGIRDPEPARHAHPAGRGRRPAGGRDRPGDRAAAPPVRRPGGARLVRPRGHLREVSPRDAGWTRRVPGGAVRLLGVRAEPGRPGRARHRHLPVGAISGHRLGHRRSPARGRARARGDQRRDVPACPRRRPRAASRRGARAEHRGDQDVHGRAARALAPRRRRRGRGPGPVTRRGRRGRPGPRGGRARARRALARRGGEPGRRRGARVQLPDRARDRPQAPGGRRPERAGVLRRRPAAWPHRGGAFGDGRHPGRRGGPDAPEPGRLRGGPPRARGADRRAE